MEETNFFREISMQSLHESLNKYNKSDILPMHMPGHKRRSDALPDWNLWEMDFTEVPGLDNLYDAEDIIKEAADRLTESYEVKKSYMLVNGSTGGLLTAIAACVEIDDTILVARNCHKAVYNAAYLNRLTCRYVYPKVISEWDIYGGIEPSDVRTALEADKSIKAVVITSPTYEGIVSDVEAIAKVVHEYNIPLIVDEAHGAHLKLMEGCTQSAVDCGADIVVQSFHKHLPALTQTAVMHLVNDKYVDEERLSRYYSMYQTSSPSYLFMASIDYALEYMLSERARQTKYFEELKVFKEKLEVLKNIGIMKRGALTGAAVYDLDPTKLLISCRNKALSGKELEEILLKDYKIQAEMSKGSNVLLMTSVMDDGPVFDRVYEALCDIDRRFVGECKSDDDGIVGLSGRYEYMYHAVTSMTSYRAMNSDVAEVSLDDAAWCVSAEYVYIYPPGVPILVPGELITDELLRIIKHYREEYKEACEGAPRRLLGLADKSAENILVVDND